MEMSDNDLRKEAALSAKKKKSRKEWHLQPLNPDSLLHSKCSRFAEKKEHPPPPLLPTIPHH